MSHPTARTYEAGTNIVATTWQTPTGWILVRDALTMGPREQADAVTPHTRPPADDDADHMLVRTVRCLEGTVEVELVCEPAFDYGRTPARWTLVGDSRHAADATGADQTMRLQTDLALGVEGNRIRARHVLHEGDQMYCSLSWAENLASVQEVGRPRSDRTRPPATGAPGWTAPACPITVGGSRSSARHWPSKV
jgi:alpha,alpha-trehalase